MKKRGRQLNRLARRAGITDHYAFLEWVRSTERLFGKVYINYPGASRVSMHRVNNLELAADLFGLMKALYLKQSEVDGYEPVDDPITWVDDMDEEDDDEE